MISLRSALLTAVLGVALPAVDASAGEETEPARPWASRPGDLMISAGVGAAFLQADEYVYNFDGSKLSQLTWESDGVPVATFEAEWRPEDPRWTLSASVSVGLDSRSYMEDYDWRVIGEDWSDRSLHPDTSLDHYLAIDAGARYDLLLRESWSLGLRGGFRYTDVKWTARGGDYVYSFSELRDTVGSFAEGIRNITYRQRLPALYLGPAASLDLAGARLSASVVGGVSFNARAIDDHWLRETRFRDDLDSMPYLGVTARADWPIGETASLFLSGDYERYFSTKSTLSVDDRFTGQSGSVPDGGGAAFQALRVNAGISLRF